MTDAVTLVQDFFAAWNTHSWDTLVSHYDPDGVWVAPAGQGEGRDEILSYHTAIWEAFPDVHTSVLHTIAEGDDVAALTLINGTHQGPFLLPGGATVQPTGRRVSCRCCWIFTLEAGCIRNQRVYWDQLELYAQLGLSLQVAETL